jgi:hypothetical protein
VRRQCDLRDFRKWSIHPAACQLTTDLPSLGYGAARNERAGDADGGNIRRFDAQQKKEKRKAEKKPITIMITSETATEQKMFAA